MFFICGLAIVDKLLAICGQTGIKTSPSIYNLSVSGLVSVNKQRPTHCLCNHLIDGLGGMATHPIVSSLLSMVMVGCSEEFESREALDFADTKLS